jgi:transposase-like protein
MNLIEFQKHFAEEKTCRDWLAEKRWGKPENAECPHCKHKEAYIHEEGKLYTCKKCMKQFTVRIGTIFEDSRLPLAKWFLAIYLFTTMKKGLSSVQLSKYISTTQKTAWFILQRLREVMRDNGNKPFGGTTEIDEAYFGAKEENKHKHKRHTTTKQVVLGMVNRETVAVKAIKVASAEKEILLPKIALNVKEGSTICTDTLQAYNDLRKHYKHHKIKHSAGEYVRRIEAFKVHTNAIEGYWSYVKRGIYGIYHWVSKKHIQGYLNEFSFRFSKRALTDIAKVEEWFARCEGKRIMYKQLING